MEVGTALSVAQTIFAALQCSELKMVCSMLGYKADLEKLQQTVQTIKAVLLDADAQKENLTHEAQLYIKRLKDAVYDADDMIDEFVTLAQQKKLTKGNKRRLFSLFKDMGVAFNMSRGVKKLKENLSDIVDDHKKFELSINHQPIRKRREETCSYIYANDIIGRDDDLVKIRGMLLDSNVQCDVSFLTVTGMGGLGKTALAQLVYNDKMVENEFLLKLWVCVSDQDLGHLDVREVLRKILVSATHGQHDGYTLDILQSKVREILVKKKFFLVLDDVWTENRDEWFQLEGFLKATAEGSWVLVTTRSMETAKIVGKGLMHKLEGLSDDNSWRLFKRTAFSEDVEDVNVSNYLVEIGQKIIKRCANVPLAIRAMGTLLYGQDKTTWERFLETGLTNIMDEQKGIMPILKLSYDNLDSSIKSCFSYCALFPKDYNIPKEKLLNIWMAQGYVVPLEKGQSIFDAAAEYFLVLLRRCFFQDVEKDEEGEIISCKIHDLMHDIALQVSGYETLCVNPNNTVGDLEERVQHVSIMGNGSLGSSFQKTRIRTYLQVGMDDSLVRELLATCKCLRTLDLSGSQFRSLPKSIGKLLHLRYLDLSGNLELQVIPKTITKLYNLMYLGIRACFVLKYLPLGMSKLTHLHTLERFMLGYENETRLFDELEDLKGLIGLRGELSIEIQIPPNGTSLKGVNSGSGTYLNGKEQLTTLGISFENCLGLDLGEELLEKLSPPPNLKTFKLMGYNCVKMPSWGMGDKLCTLLPNLVDLSISGCHGLKSLLWFGNLPHLKILKVKYLSNLEYMEDTNNVASASGSGVGELPLFPCLKILKLKHLPKLKRWWSGSASSPFLSRVKICMILHCSDMTSIPLCPIVEDLCIIDDKRSLILELKQDYSSLSSQQRERQLTTTKLGSLKLIPSEYTQFPTKMVIEFDEEVESWSQVRELFPNEDLSTLRCIKVYRCPNLRSLCGGIEHQSALTHLQIFECPKLLHKNVVEDEIPWRDLGQILQVLYLDVYTMENLPQGIQYLTTLQTLVLSRCYKLKYLPNWMPKLTSLRCLIIRYCSMEFRERWDEQSGEDWHLIRHIPTVSIT